MMGGSGTEEEDSAHHCMMVLNSATQEHGIRITKKCRKLSGTFRMAFS
jgi:hypothetical protein